MEQPLLDQVKRSSISFKGKSPYWYFVKKRHVIPSGTCVGAGLVWVGWIELGSLYMHGVQCYFLCQNKGLD